MLDDAFKDEYSVELLKIPEVPGTQLKRQHINTQQTDTLPQNVDKVLHRILTQVSVTNENGAVCWYIKI